MRVQQPLFSGIYSFQLKQKAPDSLDADEQGYRTLSEAEILALPDHGKTLFEPATGALLATNKALNGAATVGVIGDRYVFSADDERGNHSSTLSNQFIQERRPQVLEEMGLSPDHTGAFPEKWQATAMNLAFLDFVKGAMEREPKSVVTGTLVWNSEKETIDEWEYKPPPKVVQWTFFVKHTLEHWWYRAIHLLRSQGLLRGKSD